MLLSILAMCLNACYRKEAIVMEGTYDCTVVVHSWDELNGYSPGAFDTTSEMLLVGRSKFNNLELNGRSYEAWSLREGKTQYFSDSLESGSLRIFGDSIVYTETSHYYGSYPVFHMERRYWGNKN